MVFAETEDHKETDTCCHTQTGRNGSLSASNFCPDEAILRDVKVWQTRSLLTGRAADLQSAGHRFEPDCRLRFDNGVLFTADDRPTPGGGGSKTGAIRQLVYPVHRTDLRFSIESCVCREKTVYSSTMGGRLPECLANLFIVNGSAWPVVALIGAEERLR